MSVSLRIMWSWNDRCQISTPGVRRISLMCLVTADLNDPIAMDNNPFNVRAGHARPLHGLIIIMPWIWFGIMTYASNWTSLKCSGISRQYLSTIFPQSLKTIFPLIISPNINHLRNVHIVTKPACRQAGTLLLWNNHNPLTASVFFLTWHASYE